MVGRVQYFAQSSWHSDFSVRGTSIYQCRVRVDAVEIIFYWSDAGYGGRLRQHGIFTPAYGAGACPKVLDRRIGGGIAWYRGQASCARQTDSISGRATATVVVCGSMALA